MGADYWVGQWSVDAYGLSDDDYKTTYYLIGLACLIFSILRAFAIGYVTEIASIKVFKKILWNILRRPMSFFDTTPSGVIINRCINDVDIIDYSIPNMAGFFLVAIF